MSLCMDRLHSSHQIVFHLKDSAGILTYDDADIFCKKHPSQEATSQWFMRFYLIKYSNGGCSGFKPDSLLLLLGLFGLFKPNLFPII